MIPFSILDLAPVAAGSTPAESFRHTLDYARRAEALGYHRFWLAEHHNMPGVASAATAVLIGYVAGGTERIRVGAGGIMLPNHAPLLIAEQFGTLESLYPGRIDLGLGRAPGTDGAAARALRRDASRADTFPQDVVELQHYFKPAQPGQAVQAVPGAGLNVPIWLLGSSLFGAQLAALLGLPFAFASHFAPAYLETALHTYRQQFRPSDTLSKPYFMMAANVITADTNANARYLFTSVQQQFINIQRGTPTQMQPPIDDIRRIASPGELAALERALRCSVVGNPDTVQEGIGRFLAQYQPDELILTTPVFDPSLRLESMALTAQVRDRLAELYV